MHKLYKFLLRHTVGHCSKIRPHGYLVLFLTGPWSDSRQTLRLELCHEFADTDPVRRQVHRPAMASGYQRERFCGWQAGPHQLPHVWCGACQLLPVLD